LLFFGGTSWLRKCAIVVFWINLCVLFFVYPNRVSLIICIGLFSVDFACGHVIRFLYPLLYQGSRAALLQKAMAECGVGAHDRYFEFIECDGKIEHWVVKQTGPPLAARMTLNMLAAKENVVVRSKQQGLIFPLADYEDPFEYLGWDGETLDVYYRSITTVGLTGKKITLTTSDGQTISYSDESDTAKEAATYLREKVRSSPVQR
jgi:hypothetical protein